MYDDSVMSHLGHADLRFQNFLVQMESIELDPNTRGKLVFAKVASLITGVNRYFLIYDAGTTE